MVGGAGDVGEVIIILFIFIVDGLFIGRLGTRSRGPEGVRLTSSSSDVAVGGGSRLCCGAAA